MSSHVALLTIFIFALMASDCSVPVRIAPPRVSQGGRTLSLAVASTDDKRIVAATETGGLFRTFNRGKNWQHLDGLPNNRTRDVAIAFLNPNIIIATTVPQYRTLNDGGIWRSLNGGASWSQPSGWAPPPGPNCTDRPGAHGISHMPLSSTFFVGTDCGIAVSRDNGATWSNFVLDPSVVGKEAHRVRSVLVINRTSGVAASDRGLFFLDANGVWRKAQDVNTSGQVPVIHAFSAPFFGAQNVFFHASGGQKLHISTNGGATWTQIEAPSENNREAFVRVARSLSGNDQKFEVYYGDGKHLHRQTFSFGDFKGSGSWTELKTDHSDPSDMAFDLDRRIPIMLAGDGGVHVTTNNGTSWQLTGGGTGGFTALQVSEVTGQLVTGGSKPHLDLYYATQDNGIHASADGGSTWTGSICCEGRTLAVDPTSTDHEGSGVTGLRCSNCSTFITDAHFKNERKWRNAPAGDTGGASDAPFHIVEDAYLQFATNATTPPTFDGFLTLSAGAAWQKAFTLQKKPKGPSLFAGFLANPTVFQPVELLGSLPNGGTRFGLFRIKNLAGQPVVAEVDANTNIAFGSSRTPISRRAVVGVDPKNANHLIAADVQNGEMKFSADGGDNWFPLPALTQAVTDSGKFIFTIGDLSLATVIGWDPYDSCHILVGTAQNGVIRSTDGGNTWKRIEGSSRITLVSSIYFPPKGTIWVSSNGRGLWNLTISRRKEAEAGQCRFPVPRPPLADDPVIVNPATDIATPFTGPDDPRMCPKCVLVVVRNGWITDLNVAGDQVREIAISGGTISAVDRAGREVPLAIANWYESGEGRIQLGRMSRAKIGSRRVRALVLEGNSLRGVIMREGELPFAPVRTPSVFVLNAKQPGALGVHPGETVRVIGTSFVSPATGGQPIRVLFDNEVVATNVQVREDGSFSVDILVRQLPGEVIVTVEQRDGMRVTTEKTLLHVLTKDDPS